MPSQLTVGRLAKLIGVSPHTIRHYVKIGLLTPKRDESSNYQIFTKENQYYLQFIQKAKLLGFTLKDIQQFINDARQGNSPCPKVRTILQQRIQESQIKIQELAKIQQRMEHALREWEQMPNGEPTGNHVCALIELTAKIKKS